MRMQSLWFFILIVLCGCSSINGINIPDNYVAQTPSEYQIKDFPHSRQYDHYSCAAQSLAMVMSYYDGKTYPGTEVWDATGSTVSDVAVRYGNDMYGLRRAAEKYGFDQCDIVQGMSLAQLKYLISQNIPVIVNIRNFFRKSDHAVVATGYDEKTITFYDSSYRSKYYTKDYDTFLSHWCASLTSPKGRKKMHTAFILYPKK